MAPLLALVSAKRTSELANQSVSPSCLVLKEESFFVLFTPNPAFHPKNISSYFQLRDIVLMAFHPLP